MIDNYGQNKSDNAYSLYMAGHKVDQTLIAQNSKQTKGLWEKKESIPIF